MNQIRAIQALNKREIENGMYVSLLTLPCPFY
jgi:hypothetical protein